MAIGCGTKGAKVALGVFNVLFWLSGCILLALGAWIFLDLTKAHLFSLLTPSGVSKDVIFYVAYVLLTLGGVVLVAGVLGCCGALQESRCLLVTYFVLLLALLCGELGVAAVTLASRVHFLSGLQSRLVDQLSARYGLHGANHSAFTEAVDLAQYKLACCGMRTPEDYLHSRWWNDSAASNHPRNVPLTCCVLANNEVSNSGSPLSVVSRVFSGTVEEAWQTPQPKNEAACQSSKGNNARHKHGCFRELSMWFQTETLILIATTIGTAVFQILGMVFSVCLCNSLGDEV